MRSCPRCHTPHPDDLTVCPIHGLALRVDTPMEMDSDAILAAGSRSSGPGGRSGVTAAERSSSGGRSSPGSVRRAGVPPTESIGSTSPGKPNAVRHPTGPPVRREERAEDLVGQVLGSYRLLQVIGRGGMGRVYLAEHVLLGRKVALKLLRPEYAVKRDAVARFFQEAKAVNKIRHRNIVDVTDFVELEDGTTFIIMELLEGTSLGKLVRTLGIENHRLLAVLIQVCDALEAAHTVGVVHRDLKPDNIFLVPDGKGGDLVKLLDFGVAKLLTHDEETGDFAWHTAAGSVVGTPAYMSPEQAAGRPVDGRSDVYSLGAIMYELFSGQPVFSARTFGEYVLKHINEDPVPPRETAGGDAVTPELEDIILRCLAKDAGERYQDVAELRGALFGQLGLLDTGLVDVRSLLGPADRPPTPSGSDPHRATPAPRSSGLRSASSSSPGSGRRLTGSRVRPGGTLGSPSGVALAGTPLGASVLDAEIGFGDALPPELAATQMAPPELPPRRQGAGWWRPVALIAGGLGLAATAILIYELVAGSGAPAPALRTTAAPPRAAADAPLGAAPVAAAVPEVAPEVAPAPPREPQLVRLSFRSDPARAEVFAFGSDTRLCSTPCDVTVDRNDGGSPHRRVYVLRRKGYEDRQIDVIFDERERQVLEASLTPELRHNRPASAVKPPVRVPPAAEPAPPPPPPPPVKPPPDRIDPTDTLDPFGKKTT